MIDMKPGDIIVLPTTGSSFARCEAVFEDGWIGSYACYSYQNGTKTIVESRFWLKDDWGGELRNIGPANSKIKVGSLITPKKRNPYCGFGLPNLAKVIDEMCGFIKFESIGEMDYYEESHRAGWSFAGEFDLVEE